MFSFVFVLIFFVIHCMWLDLFVLELQSVFIFILFFTYTHVLRTTLVYIVVAHFYFLFKYIYFFCVCSKSGFGMSLSIFFFNPTYTSITNAKCEFSMSPHTAKWQFFFILFIIWAKGSIAWSSIYRHINGTIEYCFVVSNILTNKKGNKFNYSFRLSISFFITSSVTVHHFIYVLHLAPLNRWSFKIIL